MSASTDAVAGGRPGRPNRPTRAPALGGAILLALAASLWLGYETPAEDVGLFIAFQLGFVLAPGCLAYLALSGGPRAALRVLVTGAALGYTLLIAFYAAASAAGIDEIFWAYPALVGVPAAIAVWPRRGSLIEGKPWRPVEVVTATAAAAAAMLFLAFGFFADSPVPSGDDVGWTWHHDVVWEMSIAAELKHHFPPQIPALAGHELRYHYYAHLNEAAASKTLGIDQFVVTFRLMPMAMLLLVVGGLLELGRTLGRRAWAGVATVALVLLVGPFDPVPLPPGGFFDNLYLSDTFAFGLALFLPLLCELIDRVRAGGDRERAGLGARARLGARAGPWVVVAILIAGCSGAKGSILPVLGGGLGLALVYALWRRRGQVRAVATGLALTAGIGIATYLALYSDPATRGYALEPCAFAIAKRTEDFVELNDSLPDAAPVRGAAYTLEAAAGIIDVLAPILVGLLIVLLLPGLRSSTEAVLCAALLAVSVAIWSVLDHAGRSQIYFLFYGYAAGGALAATAIVTLARASEPERAAALRWVVPAGGALLLAACLLPAAYSRQGTLTQFPDAFNRYFSTPALQQGLRWVRENTPEDAVLAVNNAYSAPNRARNCSYTAFAERRAMLECEFGASPDGYPPLRTVRRKIAKHPFEQRFRLNERIFRRGDADALRKAADRYGVDYLFVDKRFSGSAESIAALDRIAVRVFEVPQVIVYAVDVDAP